MTRRVFLVVSLTVFLALIHEVWAAEAQQVTKVPVQEVYLSMRAAMAAAAQQNPSVLLSKERIEAAKGDVTTQLGAMPSRPIWRLEVKKSTTSFVPRIARIFSFVPFR